MKNSPKESEIMRPNLTIICYNGFSRILTKEIEKYDEISDAIANSPSISLKQLAYTKDLEDYWETLRKYSRDIAGYFFFKAINWNVYCDEELNPRQKRYFHLIDAVCERYLSIYKLIRYCFPKIRKKLSNCPATPEDLFLSIVEWELNSMFEYLITINRIEISPNEMVGYFKHLKKYNQYIKDNSSHVRKLKKGDSRPAYLKNLGCSPWYGVLEKIRTIHDKKVKFLGRNYNNAVDYLLEILKDCYSARNNDGRMFLKTMIYENGYFRYTGKK